MEEPKSWSDALAHCRLTYTDLSSIRNQSENDKITALLQGSLSTLSLSSQFAWIGLHKPKWVWSDGSDSSYAKWYTIRSNGREDCVVMTTYFYHKSCNEKYTFLCQKGESSLSTSPESDPSGLIRLFCLSLQTS